MKTLPTLAAAALVCLAPCAQADDGPQAPPKGGAIHTLQVVGDELDAARAALSEAHHRLLAALAGDGEPSRLAGIVASQHEHWLAYRNVDCELAGVLTGAGGAWPAVHGITCRIDNLAQRTRVVDSAADCLQALPRDSVVYQRQECLLELVDWTMQGN